MSSKFSSWRAPQKETPADKTASESAIQLKSNQEFFGVW
jgi:hypothetical protein